MYIIYGIWHPEWCIYDTINIVFNWTVHYRQRDDNIYHCGNVINAVGDITTTLRPVDVTE